MFLGQDILGSLKEVNIFSYVVIFWIGFLMSLGICSAVRLPLVFGYATKSNTPAKTNSLYIIIYFALGVILAYIFVGIILGTFSSVLNKLFSIQKYTYYLLSIITFLIALNFLGFIDFSFSHLHLEHHKFISKFHFLGNVGAFFLGLVFVFMEGFVAPCCGPIIYILAVYTLFKGKFFLGITLFFTYGLGQALPIFLAGSFASFFKKINFVQNNWEYVEVILGLLLFLLAIYFFIVA